MTSIHSVVSTVSCLSSSPWVEWRTLWSCVSSLIVLYILFLRANFTSNTRWESQTFHHGENSCGFYSGGFSKSSGLELTPFPGFFKQNYATLNYTLCSYMTLCSQKEGRCHWKCGNTLKFFEGGIEGVSPHNLKNYCKYFVLKGNSNYHVRPTA